MIDTQVREYHEKQRLAQLQILNELFRIDLGDDSRWEIDLGLLSLQNRPGQKKMNPLCTLIRQKIKSDILHQ